MPTVRHRHLHYGPCTMNTGGCSLALTLRLSGWASYYNWSVLIKTWADLSHTCESSPVSVKQWEV